MKIIRYEDAQGRQNYGALQHDSTVQAIDGDIFGDHALTQTPVTVARRLTPLVPTQIIGIGLNYQKHAEESGAKTPEFPIVFFKGLNSVQNPDEPIRLPTQMKSDEVDYECELAVVIGKSCLNATRENALDYVLGYTCANDVSARDWQIKKGGGQWSRGKTFDTFCPLGPCLVTRDEIPNPNALRLKTTVNSETLQDWNTNDMIFDVPQLIAFLSADTTLLPGTVILTGTPQGVGMARKPPRWLVSGDTITVEVEGIGALTNPVI